jgi:Protein of unknown function (DUF1236)
MKNRSTIAVAASVLLAGVTAASAATMAPRASDALNLTSAQQKTAWNDINKSATIQKPPASFNAETGAVVPGTLKIAPVPSKAASDVTALRPYDFAMVQGKLLIVNPSDRKVAEVISG